MKKLIKKFRNLPTPIIFLHITGKFLFGLGAGMLIASYFQNLNWWNIGAWIILISLVVQIPGAYLTLGKKKPTAIQ